MKRALVCVLDWGLGHATRSVPVILELQRQGFDVLLASSAEAGQFLRKEFPALSYHELPGYKPRYSRRGSMLVTIARQLPHLYQTVQREQREVELLVRNLRIDVVVSDNRYGCYTKQVPSIFITHQVVVKLMPGYGVPERLVNRWLRKRYTLFNEVWVPDEPGIGWSAPFLSDKIPVRHIGWLSRFPRGARPGNEIDILAIASGPEPQRSLFVEKLKGQLLRTPGKHMLVTGQVGEDWRSREGNLEIVSHLNSEEMEACIRAADIVIARSGYSTIMDLLYLNCKRAAFVPTPQQGEQILLAEKLRKSGIAFSMDQENFTVDELVRESIRYRGFVDIVPHRGLLTLAVKSLCA